MRLNNRHAKSMLAAEYVLGTLHGKARDRLELWLRTDPELRLEVNAWQEHLMPLATSLPEHVPHERVWRSIEARINPAAPASSGWLASLAFWRWSSALSAAAAAVLFGFIALSPKDQTFMPANGMVVVMADDKADPHVTVAWSPDSRAKPKLRVRVMGHAEMAPGTAWELWMLPGGDEPPKSCGLITTHDTQYVEIPVEMLQRLSKAAGMAMSVEPAGGSPTGAPTGPVLYSGKAVSI